MTIKWIKKIANRGAHNAFTDLCEFNNELYCCFREATNHISNDGAIKIISTDHQGKQNYADTIRLENTDLRDPKLSITPEGNLLLIDFARQTDENNKTLATKNLCWVSQTGRSWSSPREFADSGWWLWRLTWHNKQAYGFAYNRAANAIHLYHGDPRRTFELYQANAFSLAKQHKGYPNESDIVFSQNKAFAIVRRDAGSYSAQLGESTFPYKKWRWHDLNIYIGGPAMVLLDNNTALIGGRIVQQNKLVTGILSLNLTTKALKKYCILPSAGDNSYPGLVKEGNQLYVSYYSSHQNQKACVYLANIDLQFLLKEW